MGLFGRKKPKKYELHCSMCLCYEEKSASEVAEEHADDSEFEAAFRKARKEQGPGGTFDYKGKPYTTNYKEEEE